MKLKDQPMNRIRIGALASPALLALSILMPGSLLAEWTGGVEGGQVLQGKEKGTRLRFKLSNSERPFSQTFYADWVRGNENSNSYEAGYTPRYWFSDQTYAFGEGSLKTSKSFNIDQQIRALAGVGIQLLNTDSQSLFAEVGAGQVATTFDFNDETTGKAFKETTGIATARLGAAQTLSDLIKLELNADYSTAKDLVTTSAEAGISLRIPGGAVKYSYRLRSSTFGDNDAIDEADSSVSFNYGF